MLSEPVNDLNVSLFDSKPTLLLILLASAMAHGVFFWAWPTHVSTPTKEANNSITLSFSPAANAEQPTEKSATTSPKTLPTDVSETPPAKQANTPTPSAEAVKAESVETDTAKESLADQEAAANQNMQPLTSTNSEIAVDSPAQNSSLKEAPPETAEPKTAEPALTQTTPKSPERFTENSQPSLNSLSPNSETVNESMNQTPVDIARSEPVTQAETIKYQAARFAGSTPVVETPPLAKRRRLKGTTVLRGQVSLEGKLMNTVVHESSGHALLDEAALAQARNWQYLPAKVDGIEQVHWVQIPIVFR